MISAFLVLEDIQEGEEVMHLKLPYFTMINLFLSASWSSRKDMISQRSVQNMQEFLVTGPDKSNMFVNDKLGHILNQNPDSAITPYQTYIRPGYRRY